MAGRRAGCRVPQSKKAGTFIGKITRPGGALRAGGGAGSNGSIRDCPTPSFSFSKATTQ